MYSPRASTTGEPVLRPVIVKLPATYARSAEAAVSGDEEVSVIVLPPAMRNGNHALTMASAPRVGAGSVKTASGAMSFANASRS
jgi:hypothetical protein